MSSWVHNNIIVYP